MHKPCVSDIDVHGTRLYVECSYRGYVLRMREQQQICGLRVCNTCCALSATAVNSDAHSRTCESAAPRAAYSCACGDLN